MVDTVSAIHGRLIKWAREQQDKRMREVRALGGPVPSYQSEVENEHKTEVSTRVLLSWTQILRITPGFARGELPRYNLARAKCRGLAGEIATIASQDEFVGHWATASPPERARQILCLIADRSHRLPRVVLAYVIGVEVKQLDQMMLGSIDITPDQLQAIMQLTTLPEQFFKLGILAASDEAEVIERYLPAMQLASQGGVSADKIIEYIKSQGPDQEPPTAPRNKRKR